MSLKLDATTTTTKTSTHTTHQRTRGRTRRHATSRARRKTYRVDDDDDADARVSDDGHRTACARHNAPCASRVSRRSARAMADALRANARDQIARLLTQLADLEDAREEFDDDEYEETKAETLAQLDSFKTSLARMTTGDVTLTNELETIKSATLAAISAAFKTPEILKLFALKQPEALRERLRACERDVLLGKMSDAKGKIERVEILTALKKLQAPLEESELTFLREHMTAGLAEFVAVAGDNA
jgi:hypothetical protein